MASTLTFSNPAGRLGAWAAAARRFLLTTVEGRLIVGGAAVKVAVNGIAFAGLGASRILEGISTAGGLAILAGVLGLLYRAWRGVRHQLLWRVRRKLIISYVFIGVVPVILIIAFFVLAWLLLFANISSYLIRSALVDLGEGAMSAARLAAVEIEDRADPARVPAILERRAAAEAVRHAGISLAVVPIDADRCPAPADGAPARAVAAASAGSWAHTLAPGLVPAWVPCDGFAGVLAYGARPGPEAPAAEVFVRAVAFPERSRGFAVIADVPVSRPVRAAIEAETGIVIGEASLVGSTSLLVRGTAGTPAGDLPQASTAAERVWRFPWVALLDHVDWTTGRTGPLPINIGLSVRAIYQRLSASQASLGGTRSFGDLLLALLLFVSGLFFIIEVVALVMGLALARSITGAIHELFAGTERVRQGDFGHRIPVLARDQLGELASSFNQMTGSIEDLLRQAAEKKRLEEEMRLAREIQMSLLPRGPLVVPGVAISALCVPAREVGGDYYDVLSLPDGRFGVLIADVSGKGMSAALYMAELKGLILSLSQVHLSPRELLIGANRLISMHLDSRSFITMTYAVIDPAAGVMTYARAGHTPLLYLPGRGADGRARTLAPDGMIVGLRLDDGERFKSLLVESTLRLAAGDLLVFFTDGVSEAMNDRADCFGEAQLAELVEQHAHLPIGELRERILREITAFVGEAPQHDDMTLILLKVRGDEQAAGAS
ncbi:MAG TPA: SpoIIE family protein phosphatase [Vicinamibacterales bacterium]|nr:SpoIIE family protein phosphatase [Vicinamibacterales bacterium]